MNDNPKELDDIAFLNEQYKHTAAFQKTSIEKVRAWHNALLEQWAAKNGTSIEDERARVVSGIKQYIEWNEQDKAAAAKEGKTPEQYRRDIISKPDSELQEQLDMIINRGRSKAAEKSVDAALGMLKLNEPLPENRWREMIAEEASQNIQVKSSAK